jgi:hypothetical protein
LCSRYQFVEILHAIDMIGLVVEFVVGESEANGQMCAPRQKAGHQKTVRNLFESPKQHQQDIVWGALIKLNSGGEEGRKPKLSRDPRQNELKVSVSGFSGFAGFLFQFFFSCSLAARRASRSS